MANIGNNCVHVYSALMNPEVVACMLAPSLAWKQKVSNCCTEVTEHVIGIKNPVQLQPPGNNCPCIIFHVKTSRNHTLFTLLDNIPLDFVHSPAIKNFASKLCGIHIAGSTHIINFSIVLRTNRLNWALQASAQVSLSLTSLINESYIPLASNRPMQTGRKLTLIMKKTLMVPKTASAGVVPRSSFTRFKVSMATFNKERTPSPSVIGICLSGLVQETGATWRL